jgi:hypothetical protein
MAQDQSTRKPGGHAWDDYVRRKSALKETPEGGIGPTAFDVSKVKASEAVDWHYQVLTVLDTKASALMRLNGVMLAAAAFLLAAFGRQAESIMSAKGLDASIVAITALLSALSIALCLFVVNVKWNFLGKAEETSGSFSFSRELTALSDASKFRQRVYRTAWWISLVGVVAFALEFARQAIYIVAYAMGGCKPW